MRQAWRRRRRRKRAVRPLYGTREEAAAHCHGTAYGSGAIEQVVATKSKLYRQRIDEDRALLLDEANQVLLSALCLAINGRNTRLNVIDFGGACGAHYFAARAMIDSSVRLQWRVIETTEMVSRAKELEADELCFASSLAEAVSTSDRVDLVFSSGALPYTADPYACLSALMDCRPTCLALTRLPVVEGLLDLFTVDETRLSGHGPGPPPDGLKDAKVRSAMTIMSTETLRGEIARTHDVVVEHRDNKESLSIDGFEVSRLMLLARLRGEPIQERDA